MGHRIKRFLTTSCISLCVIVMTACGSGGGKNDPTPVVPVVNTSPTAVATSNTNVLPGATVVLDGTSSSDPNGDSLTYKWVFVSKPANSSAALVSADQKSASFTADVSGEYKISLIVNDGKIDSVPASVVVNANTPPVATIDVASTAKVGENVVFDGSKSADADGDTLTYSWNLEIVPTSSVAQLDSKVVSKPTLTPDVAGTYVVSLVVHDGSANSSKATATIVVTVTNPPPVNKPPVADISVAPTVTVGQSIIFDGSKSSDADGDTFTYLWNLETVPTSSVAQLDSKTAAKPTLVPVVVGTYVVSLVVNDGSANSAKATATVVVSADPNTPPVANAGIGQTVKTGNQVTLNGGASSDANGDNLLFAWTITSQPFDSVATLADANTAYPRIVPDKDGSYALSLVVNDGKVNSTPSVVNFTADATKTNRAPIADAGIDQSFAAAGQTQLKGGASTDPDGDPISFHWSFMKTPAGSAAKIANPSAELATFNTDLGGNYVAALVVNDGQVNSAADFVTKGLVVTGTEVESNNTSAEAQMLDRIGWGNPVKAFYEGNSTNDWYKFNAVKGMTYVVELFDVSVTLYNANNYGNICETAVNNVGLYLYVQDSDGIFVTKQCAPNGIGNGQSQTQFTPTASGTYYVKVGHNYSATALSGEYQIRILPKHTDAAAAWNATQEPNNAAANAYLMQVGLGNALTGTIEARNTSLYYSQYADVDWYRFEATAGVAYVIELFNVSTTLHNGNNYGNICETAVNNVGLYLYVQDSAGLFVTKQCAPNGIGNGQSQTQFTPTASGTYYVKVGHNYSATTLSGEYHIRILPKHDNAAAAWDITQEPNNAVANAYLMQVGLGNALTGTIEARNTALYYSQYADLDWYRFEVTAGVTYVIELFNVSTTLHNGNNYGNICETAVNNVGLYLYVQDSAGLFATKQCAPNGVANVESQTQFTPTASGTYYVKVGHNYSATTLSGEYHIRILPKHDNAAAAWDATQEPNNAVANAYLMQAGLGNALTGTIETRTTSLYHTLSSDVDWYRFEATANTTYVIELFNVSTTLHNGNNYGNICETAINNVGLYLYVQDSTGLFVTKQCAPNGVANVESQTQFTAGASGTYYIKVGHNYSATSLNGEYHIRILPKHDNAAAAWDATQEPNNAAANAYLMQVGLTNALVGTIEARTTSLYHTLSSDVDWYRFEATAGVTYVIELFNVSTTLHTVNDYGTACSGLTNYVGLYLRLYGATEAELAKQCTANGAAPLQVLLTYTAATSGTHYIKTGHNYAATALNGAYSIRITAP